MAELDRSQITHVPSSFGGQIAVHSSDKCTGDTCPVHNPSDHHMRDWPQLYRVDRRIMERICEHGVGHPDPDDLGISSGRDSGIHGCDGCCTDWRTVPIVSDTEEPPPTLADCLITPELKMTSDARTKTYKGEVTPVVAAINERLEMLRVSGVRVTQRQLAALVNTTQSHVSEILSGNTQPTLPMVMRLCAALNLKLAVHDASVTIHVTHVNGRRVIQIEDDE